MERSRQIKAWRNVSELAVSFVGKVNDNNRDLGQFILAVRQGLAVENWSDFERILREIFFGFSPRSTGMMFGTPQRSLREKLEKALEYFEPKVLENFGLKIEDDGLIMNPTIGVTLRITKLPRNSIVFRFKFSDTKAGTAFDKMIGERLGSNHSVQFGEIVYEDALNLKSELSRQWIFSSGSFDRLDGRAASNNNNVFDPHEAFAVRPLPGEKLVVYSGQGAQDIGLHVPWSRTAPHHPDTTVFASVGRFSIALKRGESQRGRPYHDHVAVFFDSRLPIAPPSKNEDGEEPYDYHNNDDHDPADRDPVEF